MVKIHKKGNRLLLNTASLLTIFNASLYFLSVNDILFYSIIFLSIVIFGYVAYSLRNPECPVLADEFAIYSPADGQVIEISEFLESEFFNDRRIKLTIKMSYKDVHITRIPVNAKVQFSKYIEGNYLVGFNSYKSENVEKSIVVLQTATGKEIMIQQKGGYIAGRVDGFVYVNDMVVQGTELGLIKCGSVVDVVFPLDLSIKVQVGQKVYANNTVIAKL